MGKLKRISFKIMKRNTSLTIACVTSILITVFLIISMINYSLNIKSSYNQRLLERAGGFDIMITGDSEDVITEEVFKEITKDGLVKSYTGGLSQYIAINGEQVYGFGLQDNKITRARYGFTLKLEEGSIIVNNKAANLLHVKLGDQILLNGVTYQLDEIIELHKFTEENMPIAIVPLSTYRTLVEREQGYDFLYIRLKDTNWVDRLTQQLSEEYPSLRITSTNEVREMKSIEMIISNYLLFLSGLIIIISILLISSIYYRYLKKSHKNIDTLRMIGANSSNIYEIMFYQSILINSIGSILGFLLAFICNKPFIEWFGKKGEWIDQEVTFHYVISIVVVLIIFGLMQLFMLHFLNKIIRNLPNMGEEKIESNDTDQDKIISKNSKTKKKKLSVKMIFLLITIGYYILNVIQNLRYEDVFLSMLLCLFLFFILFYMYSKKIIQGILKGIGKLCNKLGYIYSYVAQKLIFSQMKENIYIILTIMFLIIFSFVGNNFFRLADSNTKIYNKNKYLKEILIESDRFISYELGQKLERSLEAKNIKPLTFYNYPELYYYCKGNVSSVHVQGTSFDELFKDKLIKKEISKEEAIISSAFAKRYDIKIGDTINLISYKNLERDSKRNLKYSNYNESLTSQLTVAGIMENAATIIIIDIRSNIIDQAQEKFFDSIYLAEEGSTDKNELYKTLTELSYQYGTKWSSYQEVLKRDEKIVKEETQLLSICINTLFIFICFGMLNTLNNILLSRRKEYRVLRQLGVRRGNIVKIMVIQIFSFSCIGIILGVLFGCFVISTINFSELRSFRIQISLKEILTLISILLLFMLGTIPTMKKIITE